MIVSKGGSSKVGRQTSVNSGCYMETKTELELLEAVYKFVQNCLASNPVIVLGSGHSAAQGIPDVPQLGALLKDAVSKEIAKTDESAWQKFIEVLNQKHLEAALQEIQLSQGVLNILVKKTWEFISSADNKAFYHVINSMTTELPLSRLYEYLFRSTHMRSSLITTNYDHLAEYAADVAGYSWTTGFDYGYTGRRSPYQPMTVYKNRTPFRMVDIWKVHGSIGWHRAVDGIVYSFPSLSAIPEGYSPAIVTPGINKYKETHDEPFRSIMAGADLAIDSAKSFMCIGYGFNDDHIQPKLLERCRRHDQSIVVIVKKLTEAARKVLLDGGCKNFLALEEADDGTRMFNAEYRGGLVLRGKNLWSLGNLLDCVI